MRTPSLSSALACAALAGAVTSFGCNKASTSAAADAQAAAPPAAPDAGAAAPPPASLAFLNGFEGQIDATVKEDTKPNAQPLPVSLFVKGDKFRIDLPEQLARSSGSPMGAPTYVVVDSGQKKLYMVLDATKQVMFLDLNKAQDMMKGFAGRPGPGGRDAGPPKVTKTGRFETVAGYRCEDWDVASEHRDSTVCVANEGGSWFSIPFTNPSPETSWMSELLDGKHFPLRAIQYDKDGTTETSRLEVTKIEKKTLPDDEFQFPPGYTQIDLGKMIQGFAGMPPGGMAMPPGMGGMPPGMAGMHGMQRPPAPEKK